MTSLRKALTNYERSIMTTTPTATASATASRGLPVFALATMVLFVLKVAGEAGATWGLANISWWLVFTPLLIGFAIAAVILVIALIIVLVAVWND